jgi:UDP-4-amino-4,6-dideoxy-N-acetyl-beta-L-altrosamine transaminase
MNYNTTIPYGLHHITDDDIVSVNEVLKSRFLTQGPKAQEFENNFAEYVGAKYAVAVSNGTAALHLAAKVLDVKQSQKVITTPITFAASANSILYCNGEIEFCDIDKETYLIDIEKVKELLYRNPRNTYSGIIPVDFAGYPLNMQELYNLAKENDLWVIEDACHAPGAHFQDNLGECQKCGNGNFADLTIFSFHPVKHIACGEGGMITTSNEELYNRLKKLRTHGITKNPDELLEKHGEWYYEMVDLGYNYRMTDIQAALGVSQLKRAKQSIDKRNTIAQKYNQAFAGYNIITPKVSKSVRHAYHLYVVLVQDRKGLFNYLRKNNIFAQVHYIPVHLQPYYRNFGWKKGDFPVAEEYYSKCLSLPMYPTLTEEEQNFVIEKVIEFVKK